MESARNIQHIVAICYDKVYTPQEKAFMQDTIIKAEQGRGHIVTPISRITFTSFYDNEYLHNESSIKYKLKEVYLETYGAAGTDEKAENTIAREVLKNNGEIYVKFFVLYE